jgi:hypothetical protein
MARDERIRVAADIGCCRPRRKDLLVAAIRGARMNELDISHSAVTVRGTAVGGGLARRIGDLDHLEEMLGRAAIRAAPVVGDVRPARPWRDAVPAEAQRFVIGKAAAQAEPTLEVSIQHELLHRSRLRCDHEHRQQRARVDPRFTGLRM